jgi:hypothetical protein
LKNKYIEQGGRCAYSKIPIYPIQKHKYMMSAERKNPLLGYIEDNIILVVIGLNCPLSGQFLNEDISEEQRELALTSVLFNQEYWDISTLLTHGRRMICEKIRNAEREFLKAS